MTTIAQLLAHRDRTTPGAVLADDSLNALRYETLRSLSVRSFAALHASAMIYNERGETLEAAFDRMVDVLILTRASDERKLHA